MSILCLRRDLFRIAGAIAAFMVRASELLR
jgi:hypothetical protein